MSQSVMQDWRQLALEERVEPEAVMVDFLVVWRWDATRGSTGGRWVNQLTSMLTQYNTDPLRMGHFAENEVLHE